MFCNKCGTQVPDGQAFCPTCGNPLGAARPVAPQQAPYQQPYQQPYGAPIRQASVNIDFKKLLPILIISLVCLCLIFSLFKCGSYTTTETKVVDWDVVETEKHESTFLSLDFTIFNAIFGGITILAVLGLKLGVVKNKAFCALAAVVSSFISFFVMLAQLILLGDADCGYSVLGWFTFVFELGVVILCAIQLLPLLKEKK